MRTLDRLPVLLAAALAAGCASVPDALQREVVDVTPRQARELGRTGADVRWGGRILATRNEGGRTCFDLMGSALDRDSRPADMTDDGSGQFVACRAGYYDPAVFLRNRELTVVGRIEGFDPPRTTYGAQRPRVLADAVFLWPKARAVDARYPSGRPWPWMGVDWDPGW